MSSPMSRPQIPTGPTGAGAPPSWLYLTDPARATAEYGLLIAALPLRQLRAGVAPGFDWIVVTQAELLPCKHS